MADEFMKGFGLLSGAGLLWIVFAGWYRTSSFESTRQLIEAPPEPNTVFDSMGIFLADLMLWTALVGAFVFWVIIPAGRRARGALVADEE
ncbi:MAG: hypothetical protein V5A38_09120 [Halolamina sp.]|uniref:DUF7314 family protein n=1 Tax=Halolamina sp. TaxID=1940283 RepID=UPI002FC34B26